MSVPQMTSTSHRSPLVGRAPELRQFVAALTRAEATGVAEMMSIDAESGMGTTRLLREMRATASALGWRVIGPELPRSVIDLDATMASEQPFILLADDVHLLDDDIVVALEALLESTPDGDRLRNRGPSVIVVARANVAGQSAVTLRETLRFLGAPQLTLRPLDATDASELATAQLGRALSPHEQTLIDQAGGAPGRIVDATAAIASILDTGSSRLVPSERRTAAPLTSFIGREHELSELRHLLQSERLVTIIGPGGAGKTRLAHEVTSGIGRQEGVWVELARTTDGPGVLNALRVALGIVEADESNLADRIVGSLTDLDRCLIVLDNAEHLLEAVTRIARRILEQTTGVQLLITSREPLGVPGELIWRIPPLTCPTLSTSMDVSSRAALSPEALAEYEAVRLFIDRAARARRGFTLTAGNAPHVRHICAQLDGLPLAIELAGARVRSMPPERIAAQLDSHLGSRVSGSNEAADRHQTLESCIAWSEGLLDDAERRVFRRLCVFVGGFTLDAAQYVAAAHHDVDDYEIGDIVTRLVDKSLVALDDEADRYSMLETIRAYGLARLEFFDELDATRRAHVAWLIQWLQNLDDVAHAEDAQQFIDRTPIWLKTIGADIANCHAAFGSVEAGSSESLRLAAGLGYYWLMTSSYDEALRYGAPAVAAGDPASPEWVDAAMWNAGVLHNVSLHARNEFIAKTESADSVVSSRARTRFEGSTGHMILGDSGPTTERLQQYADLRAAASKYRDWFTFTNCTYVPGSVCAEMGMLDAAEQLLTGFVNHRILLAQATVALWRGQLVLASELADRAAQEVRDQLMNSVVELAEVGFVHAQIHLAFGHAEVPGAADLQTYHSRSLGTFNDTMYFFEACTRLCRGDVDGAVSSFEEVLTSSARIYRAYAQLWLARLYLTQRHVVKARSTATSLIDDWQHLRPPAFDAIALLVLAECAVTTDARAGLDFAHRSLASAAGGGLWTAVVDALETIGVVLVTGDRVLEGARLLGAAQAARDTMSYRYRFEHRRTMVDTAMTRAVESVGWAEGLALPLSAAVELAQRMRGERGRPTVGWESLTPTEEMVVTLVTSGLTNPQIAERMFVSRATVKTHLVHVFDKLGVTSRAELAARSATRNAPS